jgi:hypothetical protein
MVNNNFQFVGSQVKDFKMLICFISSTVDGFDLPMRILVKKDSEGLALDYRVHH